METYSFSYNKKQFKIILGGMTSQDMIEYKKEGDTNTYAYVIGDITRISKMNKEAIIAYTKRVYDVEGRNMFPDMVKDVKYINGAEQENFQYFYDMYIGNTKLGKALDQMVIDAVLIAEEEMSMGVFGNNGTFYKPLRLTIESSVNADGTYNLRAGASDGAGDEVSYMLMNTQEVNDTGIFDNVDPGKITIMATSELSMPAISTVQLKGAYEDTKEVL